MTTRLRHVAAVNPPTPEFDRLPDEAAVSFLPLEAIWPGGNLDTSRRRPRHEVSVGYTRFREGDVLLPKITPTFQADRTVIVSGLEGGIGAGTTELHIVRAGPSTDTRYIRYLLSSKPFLDEGEASMFGVAGQKRVPDSSVRDLVVPVMERPRQRAIADYLDAETTRIDALIDKKRRMVTLLKERFCTYRSAQMVGQNWPRLRRKYLVESPTGGAWGSEAGEDEVDVECYRVADFDRWLGTAASDYPTIRSVARHVLDQLSLAEGDLLIEKSGGGKNQPVGFVARFAGSATPAVCSNFVARLRPVAEVDARFAGHIFAALYDQGMTLPYIKQTTGIQNLDLASFLSQAVDIPATDVQVEARRRIDRAHRAITQLLTKLNRQLSLLAERRQALITAAVTGELDIPGMTA